MKQPLLHADDVITGQAVEGLRWLVVNIYLWNSHKSSGVI